MIARAFVATVLVWSSAVASAQVALEWTAPAGCPTRERVLEEIERLLGRPGSGEPAMRVRADVVERAGSYEVLLRTESDGGQGERALSDPSCARVGEAIALVIALALDPAAVAETLARPSPPPPPLGPDIHVAISAGWIGDIGTLPGPTVGLEAAIALIVDAVRVELFAESWLTGDVQNRTVVPGGARVRLLFAAGARGCLAAPFDPIELGGCIGLEAGLLEARGYGISMPATGQGAWLAVALGPALALRLTESFVLRLDADVMLVPLRPAFSVGLVGPEGEAVTFFYEPSWIAGRLRFAIELRY